VRQVLEGEGVGEAKISLAFVDDATIHRLNNQFLQHDEPTDVITFPMSGPGAKKLEGELVISAETARRVAEQLGHPPEDEAALYVVHGLLHLCGYDDLDAKSRPKMRARERHHLQALGIQLRGSVDEG
jgi:probable rRNA maturation factor